MTVFRRLIAFIRRPAVAVALSVGLLFGTLLLIAPDAHATASPVTQPVYACDTKTVDFIITVPVPTEVSYEIPGGEKVTYTLTNKADISSPSVLVNGTYRLIIKVGGVDYSQDFVVACVTTTPSPSATTTPPAPPTCVTLTDANIHEHGTLIGNQMTYETITLTGKVTDYCNDFAFSGVGHTISNPASIWNPAQVVAFVDSKVVGKSGLTATATVPNTTCGQNDWYTGVGPKVGDKLSGPGQGYEATHKFLSGIFGGANTWYQNLTKCATVTPSPTATTTPSATTSVTPSPSITVTVAVPTTAAPTNDATKAVAVVAIAPTCAAGKVLYKGNCVLPKDVPSGQAGTSLLGSVAPLGAAAAVLGLGGFLLYRRSRRVV